MKRETCEWDELRPGDVIITCNNVVWWTPHTLVRVYDVSATSDCFKIDYVSADGFHEGATYNKSAIWLVDRPHRDHVTAGPPA